MVKLSEIIEFMDGKFPRSYAEDYDNVGLLLGRQEAEISKAMLCLDCDRYVVREAVREGAQLIISHHPIIFGGIKSVTDGDSCGEMLLEAAENSIAVFCAHTNLDNCPGGLTEYLCSRLDLEPVETIEGNVGRVCRPKKELRLLELCATLKNELGAENVDTTARMNRPIRLAAVCNGGGGDLLDAARGKGADVYVTGDLKYHKLREAYLAENFDVIAVSHYNSERIVTELLFDALKERFGSALEAVIAKDNPDAVIRV